MHYAPIHGEARSKVTRYAKGTGKVHQLPVDPRRANGPVRIVRTAREGYDYETSEQCKALGIQPTNAPDMPPMHTCAVPPHLLAGRNADGSHLMHRHPCTVHGFGRRECKADGCERDRTQCVACRYPGPGMVVPRRNKLGQVDLSK